MYIKGILIIFLIWGGENDGIYILKLEINMNFDQKALNIGNLGFLRGNKTCTRNKMNDLEISRRS